MGEKAAAPPKRNIYVLKKGLDPEEIAAVFARASRSSKSFREIIREVTPSKAAQLLESWVIRAKPPHKSLADHAWANVAVENISRLSIENLESNRFGGYTERSTRYQKFSRNGYHVPVEIIGTELEPLYHAVMHHLFDTYWICLGEKLPIDVCRNLLPTGTVANVGVSANATTLMHAVTKLLSSQRSEERQIGKELQRTLMRRIPTLINSVSESEYLLEVQRVRRELAQVLNAHSNDNQTVARIVRWGPSEGENALLVGAAYRPSTNACYEDILQEVESLPPEKRGEFIFRLIGLDFPEGQNNIRNSGEPIVRESELPWMYLELLTDQGAFFDLKRHRAGVTLIPQDLGTELGYITPLAVVEAGLQNAYEDAIEASQEAYQTIESEFPGCGAYVLTQAQKRRYLMGVNLRSLYHVLFHRTDEFGHFGYNRAARAVYEAAVEADIFPFAMAALGLILEGRPSVAELESKYFFQT